MKSFADSFIPLYQLNRQVLDSAREGRWQQCISLAERYIGLLHAVMAEIPDARESETSEALRHLAAPLFAIEQEIAGHIAKQRAVLKESMLMLQRGKQAGQYYARQEIALPPDRP